MAIQILSLQYPEILVSDTCVSSINPSLSYGNLQYLRCGRDSVGAKWRLLIKPDISLIPLSAKILKAEIKLKCYEPNSGTYNMHQITAGWNENVTWSGQPSYDFSTIQQQNLNLISGGWYSWDILSLVNKWIVGINPNYGVLIKANNESLINYVSFYSSSFGINTGNRPIFYFEYLLQGNKKAILLKSGKGGGILL